MATAANTANINSIEANTHSPRHSADVVNSPQSTWASRVNVSSPWNEILRGESDEEAVDSSHKSIAAVAPVVVSSTSSSSLSSVAEEGSSENGNVGKKTAWKRPSDGPGPAPVEFGPFMGTDSWPALSESTRSSAKLSVVPAKGLTDVAPSSAALQGNGNASSLPQKPSIDSKNANPATNYVVTARQRSFKRNGSTTSNGGVAQASVPVIPSGDSKSNVPSGRDHNHQRSGPVSHSQNGSEHLQHQRSFRNRNGGTHQRGDGAYHHNHGTRRDQDRGHQEWSSHKNFNRDSHMPQQRNLPRFVRPSPPPPPPPPVSGSFIAPAPVRPYGGTMVFPDLPPQVYYVPVAPLDLHNVPFYPPIQHQMLYYPPPDQLLHAKILRQIEYYFSNENLVKDIFLRKKMDKHEGWVHISLIAGFPKVAELTKDVQLTLDAVRSSSVLEVQGEKVRKRNDWIRWIIPESVQGEGLASRQGSNSLSHDALATAVQSLSLSGRDARPDSLVGQSAVPADISRRGSSSGDLNSTGETGQSGTADFARCTAAAGSP